MRLSSVDLPAFGGPAIATTRPSRSRSPRPAPASASAISSRSSRAIVSAGPIKSSGTSASSEKSIRASTSASASISRAPPGLGAIAEQALELAIGLPALRLGLGADQIGQALDRGEIEPAVLEGAARELAGLGRPQAFDAAERAEHRGNHRAAAVQLQLGDVFAGLAVRARETTAPAPRRSLRRWPDRARGRGRPCAAPAARPASAFSASPARGPEMRTTAIAAGGRPEERAKMVSRARAGIARTEAPHAR